MFRKNYVDCRNVSGKDGPHSVVHVVKESVVRVLSKAVEVARRQFRAYLNNVPNINLIYN